MSIAAPVTCMIFPNGMVATFDQGGNQIPEYQGRRENALKALRDAGYEVGIDSPGEYRIFRKVLTDAESAARWEDFKEERERHEEYEPQEPEQEFRYPGDAS